MLLGLAESAMDWKTATPMKDKENGERVRYSSGMAHTPGPLTAHYSWSDEDDKSNGGQAVLNEPALFNKPPPLQRETSVYTEEDEAEGKALLRLLHMVAAFAVVGFNVAGQWVGGSAQRDLRIPSVVTVSIGLTAFLIFCMMQWLSGANDADIPDALEAFRGARVAYTFCSCLRPCCFCPPGFQHNPELEPALLTMCDCCTRSGKRTVKQARVICASWWFICMEMVVFVALCSTTAVEALTLNSSAMLRAR